MIRGCMVYNRMVLFIIGRIPAGNSSPPGKAAGRAGLSVHYDGDSYGIYCNVIIMLVFAVFALCGMTACEKEGPAENAGKALDEAVSDMAE